MRFRGITLRIADALIEVLIDNESFRWSNAGCSERRFYYHINIHERSEKLCGKAAAEKFKADRW